MDERAVAVDRRTRNEATTPTWQPERRALTVLVPTRNEAANVAKLLDELMRALSGIDAEVLFVDDSDDDTPQVIADTAAQRGDPVPVRVLHRSGPERTGGLSGAAVAGMRIALGDHVCVMDGDLQHPPDVVPALLTAARSGPASLVVATRYDGTGDSAGLSSFSRRGVSRTSSWLAKCLFPVRLRGISDPMSGFFLVERDMVQLGALRPDGFKILLEIAARTPGLEVAEVPYSFGPRYAGTTNASMREGFRFARHITRLRASTLAGASRTRGSIAHATRR